MIRWWGRTAGVPHSFPGSIRALACGGWRPRRPLFRRIAGGTPNTASIRGNDIPVVGGWRAMDRNVHAPRRLVRPQFSVKLTASRGMPWGENQVKKSDGCGEPSLPIMDDPPARFSGGDAGNHTRDGYAPRKAADRACFLCVYPKGGTSLLWAISRVIFSLQKKVCRT